MSDVKPEKTGRVATSQSKIDVQIFSYDLIFK